MGVAEPPPNLAPSATGSIILRIGSESKFHPAMRGVHAERGCDPPVCLNRNGELREVDTFAEYIMFIQA